MALKNIFQQPVRDSIDAHLKAHETAELLPSSNPVDVDAHVARAAWFRETGKIYTRMPKIALDSHLPAQAGDLVSLLRTRTSIRQFATSQEVPLTVVGQVLSNALSSHAAHRPFPSAGARYPTEVYLVANSVTNLTQGLYHFDPRSRTLARLLDEPLADTMAAVIGDDSISTPSFYLVLTSVLHRSMVKYGGRGYRFALIEIGAVAQSLQLTCQAEGLAVVWIGGFADAAVRELLDLNFELEMETPMLLLAVGYASGLIQPNALSD